MHRIDPMHRERAMAVLLKFCQPLLKLEKKIKFLATLWIKKKSPNIARILEKLILRLWELSPDLTWLIPLKRMPNIALNWSIVIGSKIYRLIDQIG